jgi:glucosamine--fructose-6-phosphate aminotransferase (isomerizing)
MQVVAQGHLRPPLQVTDEVITIPDCHEAVLPIMAAIPVQLLSN